MRKFERLALWSFYFDQLGDVRVAAHGFDEAAAAAVAAAVQNWGDQARSDLIRTVECDRVGVSLPIPVPPAAVFVPGGALGGRCANCREERRKHHGVEERCAPTSQPPGE